MGRGGLNSYMSDICDQGDLKRPIKFQSVVFQDILQKKHNTKNTNIGNNCVLGVISGQSIKQR